MLKKVNQIFKNNIIGTQNLIRYYYFNRLFKLFFANKKSEFYSLVKDGYIKIDKIDENIISSIVNEIKKQSISEENASYEYSFNENLKILLKKLVDNNLKNELDKIKQIYNLDLIISNLELKRNFHFNKADHNYESIFSENYHEDKYICTQIKQFIYLSYVSEESGPFSFFKINESKKFIKEKKLDNRFNLKIDNNKKQDYKDEIYFLGNPGDSMIVDTSECLHRANIPYSGNYRDMLTITYNFVISKDNKSVWALIDKSKNFWQNKNTDYLSKEISKPGSYYKLIKIFISSVYLKILNIKLK